MPTTNSKKSLVNPPSDAGKTRYDVFVHGSQEDPFPDHIKVQVITLFETSDALALACC